LAARFVRRGKLFKIIIITFIVAELEVLHEGEEEIVASRAKTNSH
jgi:hypothetical protein